MEEKTKMPEEKKATPPARPRGAQTAIVLQPYMWRHPKKGASRLEAAPPIACRTAMDGKRRLEKIRAGETGFAGAYLVSVTADPEMGDYGEPEFLDQAGDVPDREE